MDQRTFKVLKVKLTDYEILQTFGTDSFWRVRLAKHKQNGEYVALKMLKKEDLSKLITQYRRIQSFLILIIHFQEKNYLLFTYLRNKGKLENKEAKFYASQVVLIIEYLHVKNIVYRDLKHENLLISADGYLKLIDFGFAVFIDFRTYTLFGTPEYLAPKILLNKGLNSNLLLNDMVNQQIGGVQESQFMKCYEELLHLMMKILLQFIKKYQKENLNFLETLTKAKSSVKHLLVDSFYFKKITAKIQTYCKKQR
ncbi:unnamed protein product [Paramecium sonneborni]|uniref:Protein kinase domain-containing protein n=1 Tax=Paramecium sonneborni TaxID=65129 RepID=A0A8S1LMN9_9CILI|nr:unnamed protein product [Paramecium sonneborni]